MGNLRVEETPFNFIKSYLVPEIDILLITIPLESAFKTEIIPAYSKYMKKWDKFIENNFYQSDNAPMTIIKAIYWMDKWALTVKPSTFDLRHCRCNSIGRIFTTVY